MFFFCNTCNASSYTKTTDRLDFGGKPSKFEDGCYREKFRNIVAWAEPDPKTAFFRVLGYPSGILRTAYRKQFYPKPMVLVESRDSEGVNFASLESL